MLDAVTLLRTLHGLLPPAWDDALAPATPDDYGAPSSGASACQ